METNGKFYLGRVYDPVSAQTTSNPLIYDPDDLTTHGVVVGMTGSGKTGLCIDLLEEAALQNIPALMIDPKGDITNTLLHFPDMQPADFQPWVNPDEARREGKSIQEAAVDVASLWRTGLGKWGITPERVRALNSHVSFAIYTPGSDAGLPVSILASLKSPGLDWDSNREMLREKISGTVTALLGLIGLRDIDPVRSREHILLANVFEHAWSRDKDLDLGELIMQTQAPPFEKLGVFDVNTFFPEKDRFELSMLLNNILASPAFQAWIEGVPLDVGALLYDESGKPRHSVFYIAHLNDAERMFFVTLLYSAVETWMRRQAGSTSLRALVYFDEIFGYLPPTGNPPSKEPMLRLLKQARAFGVGMVLATQNPVDVDYKALSNAGTWFIGKLATEQDKERLLDGLASAIPGGLDKREFDDLISSLGKRVFLARNVHEPHPIPFQTRWAMNYLAGPLTRRQIPKLNQLAGASSFQPVSTSPAPATAEMKAASPTAAPPQEPVTTLDWPDETAKSPETELPGTSTKPAVPTGIQEYFLPVLLTPTAAADAYGRPLLPEARILGSFYRPVLLAQANVRYLQRKYNLNYEGMKTALVHEPDRRGSVRWEDHLREPINERKLDRRPAPEARFAGLEEPLSQSKTIRGLETDFIDWVYRSAEVTVKASEALKVYAGPEVSEGDFRKMCEVAADEKMQVEAKKEEERFKKKLAAIEQKLSREKRELSQDEDEYSRRKQQEIVKHAETIFGLFTGKRRSISSSMTKRGMTARAKEDIEESKDAIERFGQEIEDLKLEMDDALEEIDEKWDEIASDFTEIPVNPYKKDILAELFGVAWFPYHLVQSGDRVEEFPAYGETD